MLQRAHQLVQPPGRVRQVSRRLPRGEGAEHPGPALPLARLRAGGQGAGQLRRLDFFDSAAKRIIELTIAGALFGLGAITLALALALIIAAA